MQEEVVRLLAIRKWHFQLESGHHGDLWLDLELLCLRPEPVRRFAAELAKRLYKHNVGAVCGPLVEGAFVALMVASELDVDFSYSERFAHLQSDALYLVEYRVPRALRARLRGRRVAIVNDVINAGSAVRGTFEDLRACGAEPVAIGALLVLGSCASSFAADRNIVLESIAYPSLTLSGYRRNARCALLVCHWKPLLALLLPDLLPRNPAGWRRPLFIGVCGFPEREKGRAPIGAGGDELQLSRAVRALAERHHAREYTRAKAPPGESPFGRSQTLKSERLRQPAKPTTN